jgi:hypothetical protein
MMSLVPAHHPAEETLLRYAAGSLAPGPPREVATRPGGESGSMRGVLTCLARPPMRS